MFKMLPFRALFGFRTLYEGLYGSPSVGEAGSPTPPPPPVIVHNLTFTKQSPSAKMNTFYIPIAEGQ